MPKKTIAERYAAKIEAIIKRGEEQRGYIAEVTRQLVPIIGRTVSRQQVDGWLARDPAKRVQPDWVSAESLFEAAEVAGKVVVK